MYGGYYGYGYYWDPTYFLVLVGLVLCLGASALVNSTMRKYSKVRNMRGLTGAEAARNILNRDACGGEDIGGFGVEGLKQKCAHGSYRSALRGCLPIQPLNGSPRPRGSSVACNKTSRFVGRVSAT